MFRSTSQTSYGLETVNIRGGRRYLADHLPMVNEVIADLEKEGDSTREEDLHLEAGIY